MPVMSHEQTDLVKRLNLTKFVDQIDRLVMHSAQDFLTYFKYNRLMDMYLVSS